MNNIIINGIIQLFLMQLLNSQDSILILKVDFDILTALKDGVSYSISDDLSREMDSCWAG